jgi:hypothetical protein
VARNSCELLRLVGVESIQMTQADRVLGTATDGFALISGERSMTIERPMFLRANAPAIAPAIPTTLRTSYLDLEPQILDLDRIATSRA